MSHNTTERTNARDFDVCLFVCLWLFICPMAASEMSLKQKNSNCVADDSKPLQTIGKQGLWLITQRFMLRGHLPSHVTGSKR